MGTGFLCKKLNMLLINHIKQSLPSIKAQITRQLMFYSQELEAYGEPVEEQTKANQGGMMLSLISRFAAAFCDAIDGKSAEGLAMNELYGGARIRYIFEEVRATHAPSTAVLPTPVSDLVLQRGAAHVMLAACTTASPTSRPPRLHECVGHRFIRVLLPDFLQGHAGLRSI